MRNGQVPVVSQERGSALVVVVLVLAFLQIVGLVLFTVTAAGPRIAGNLHTQQIACNAAETGFDVAWTEIEEFLSTGTWANFEGHYLSEPVGIDDPISDNYFRKKTDAELLNLIDPNGDGSPDLSTVIHFRQPFILNGGVPDTRYTYTIFLIDDEAGSGVSNQDDALMVCIGSVGTGNNMTTTRIEVELVLQVPGTTSK